MNKFIDKMNAMCTPKVFRLFRDLFFWYAAAFCLVLGYCLVAAKISAAGYAIGGMLTCIVMYFVNLYAINTLEQKKTEDNDDSADTSTPSTTSR